MRSHHITRWRVLLLTLALAGAAVADDLSVGVRVDRERIYAGESFLLHVEVRGVTRELPQVDLSALAQANVRAYTPQSMTTASYVNGAFTRSARVTFSYAIQPAQVGPFATGPIRLQHQGRTWVAQGPTVTVTGVDNQSNVVVRVVASSETVLVDEPFTVSLSVAVAPLPPAFAASEPLHPQQPPHVRADYLNQAEIRGLKGPDLNAVLSGLISRDNRTPALTLNDYVSREPDILNNPFSFGMGDPFEPRPFRFRFPPKRVERNGVSFWEYALTLDYTPQQEGDYTFGPVVFKGSVIVDADRQGRAVTREVFAIGPAVTVRVVPPPETDRPDWFVGSVGRSLQARAEFDTRVCRVGDPLTLDLDVTGQISLANLRPPVLGLQPGLTTDFRIYDEDVVSSAIPGGKRFRYRVRPLRAGTLEFPSIRMAYYDTQRRAYVTVQTDPIPVQARATTQIASATEGDEDLDPEAETQSLAAAAGPDPAGITVTAAGARPTRVVPPAPLVTVLAAAPPVACALVWGLVWLWTRRGRWRERHRQGTALRHAAGVIDRASHEWATDPARLAGLAAGALRDYVGTRGGADGRALTSADVLRVLQQGGVDPGMAREVAGGLAELEAVGFQSGRVTAEAVQALVKRVRTWLPEIERALRRTPPGGRHA